jgi:hypothetical protein
MPSSSILDALSAMRPQRELPERPDAAARRGSSIGRRNASACNGCGNGGSPAPWGYKRRISELGPLEPRSKQYRHQYRRAVGYLAYDAAVLRPVDVNVADVLLELTDYRTTEAQIAAQLPPKSSGKAVSKRVASDALDRLRAAGLVDWDHGTTDDFYDDKRRALLNGRWQGPPTYRLLIPKPLHEHILESEAAAKTRTWRDKNQNRRSSRHIDDGGPSPRELDRRQAQSNAIVAATGADLASVDHAMGDSPYLRS